MAYPGDRPTEAGYYWATPMDNEAPREQGREIVRIERRRGGLYAYGKWASGVSETGFDWWSDWSGPITEPVLGESDVPKV